MKTMEPNSEIRRLLDIIPAYGRTMTKIVSKPEQKKGDRCSLSFTLESGTTDIY